MATLSRVRIAWVGTTSVGPGVSTFYSSNSDPAAFITALRTWFGAFNGLFPLGTVIKFPSAGETIESTDGAINGAWTMTPLADLTGVGGATYAAGVGLRVSWNTAGITRRRRVRGSTFLVPIASSLYQNNGTIDDASLALVNGAIPALIAADGGSMRVYSRPSAVGATDGAAHAVLSGNAPDKVSWLRSRRT